MFYGQWEITNTIDATEQDVAGKLLSFAPEKDSEGNDLPLTDLFVPDISYKNLITEEPLAWDKHCDIKFKPVADDIVKVLKMYNVFIGEGNGVKNDVKYIFEYIDQNLLHNRQVWLNKKWGVAPHFQTILQLDKYMKETV